MLFYNSCFVRLRPGQCQDVSRRKIQRMGNRIANCLPFACVHNGEINVMLCHKSLSGRDYPDITDVGSGREDKHPEPI